jgi:hypothetical protein
MAGRSFVIQNPPESFNEFRCANLEEPNGLKMLVKRFKIRRNFNKGGFGWLAESEMQSVDGHYRGFTAVGRTLADVKVFVDLVRLCQRTGKLERLSEKHPSDFEKTLQTTWGGDWYFHKRKSLLAAGAPHL